MISNLRSAGASIWSGRRLCLKALPVSCQFATGQPLDVAHSSLPLANQPWHRQVDHYLHASNGNGNLGRADIKGSEADWFCWFEQANRPSSSRIKAMEWPCPRCTFVNKGELLECELCAQPFISESSGLSGDTAVTGFDGGDQIEGEDLSLGWGCSVCTFLNYGKQPACQVCGERRAGDAADPATELRLGSSFRPFRETQRPSMPGGIGEASVPNVDDQPKLVMGGGHPSHVLQPDASQSSSPEEQAVLEEALASDTLPFERDEEKQANNSHKRKIETSTSDYDGVSNSLLKMLHDERMKRSAKAGSLGTNDDVKATELLESTKQKRAKNSIAEDAAVQDSSRLVIMFYNVWFREDVEMHKRMAAIGKLIEDNQPHLICFQEVTLNIYNVFQGSTWWKQYNCSVSPHQASKRSYFTMQLCKLSVAFQRSPFSNSVMGRELCLANLDVGSGKKVVIATSHLESPCPAPPTWDQMFSKERVQQAVEALTSLNAHSNTIFGGDMNWNDKLDGAPPLPGGWADAWLELRPTEPGFTYDSKANPMLGGGRSLRSRLDRVFCHLKDFTLESIEMIGLQEIPGVTYEKEKKVKKQVQMLTLPVLPSDHFGLLLKIRQKDEKD